MLCKDMRRNSPHRSDYSGACSAKSSYEPLLTLQDISSYINVQERTHSLTQVNLKYQYCVYCLLLSKISNKSARTILKYDSPALRANRQTNNPIALITSVKLGGRTA